MAKEDVIKVVERNGTVYKNADFKQMPLNEEMIVEKRDNYYKEFDGKYGKSYLVSFYLNGEKISTFLTENEYKRWEKIPVNSKVSIKRECFKAMTTFTKIGTVQQSSSNSTQLTEKQKMILKFMVENNMKPTDRVIVDDKVTTFEQYLGQEVVKNPQKYLN